MILETKFSSKKAVFIQRRGIVSFYISMSLRKI